MIYIYIKLYVFWDTDAMCEVTGEVRGHAHLLEVKVKAIWPNKVKNDRFQQHKWPILWAILDSC